MIDPIDPTLQDICALALVDSTGSSLTLHRTGGFAGLVMSEQGRLPVSIQLDRKDRAALICELMKLQQDKAIA